MGAEQSRTSWTSKKNLIELGVREPLPETLWCSICYEWKNVDEFRALNCGHYYCEDDLAEWAEQDLIACPACRIPDHRKVTELNDLHTFRKQLFLSEPPDESPDGGRLEIEQLLHVQMKRRAKTIRFLRAVAVEVASIELTGSGVKIGGSALGLVGGGLVVVGTALSLSGVAAPVGVPLALAGAAVGGSGGLIVGGTIIGEAITKNKRLAGANEHLQLDYFHSIQIQILVGRASRSEAFAKRIDIPLPDALSMLGVMGRVAKFGTTTASVAIRAASLAKGAAVGVTRGATTAGLHIAGIVVAAALIPIDIYQMVVSSMHIHKRNKSAVVLEIEENAAVMQARLCELLLEKRYTVFRLPVSAHCRLPASTQSLPIPTHRFLLLAVRGEEVEEALSDILQRRPSVEDIDKSHVILHDSGSDATVFDGIYEFWSAEEIEQNTRTARELLQPQNSYKESVFQTVQPS